jgi:hypothetical protein
MKKVLCLLCLIAVPSCSLNHDFWDGFQLSGPLYQGEEYGCRWIYDLEREQWLITTECSNKKKFLKKK